MEPFELEGKRYFHQMRKCGRKGCKCQAGQLHGPYIYARDLMTGKVEYIGRHLPDAVAHAKSCFDLLLSNMVKMQRDLRHRLTVLERLISNGALSDADVLMLSNMGFGSALVAGHAGDLVCGRAGAAEQEVNRADPRVDGFLAECGV